MFQHDPVAALTKSDDIMALAARRTLLAAKRPGDTALMRERLRQIYDGQSRDGSWNGSVLDTLQALFLLHALGEERSHNTDSALEFLMADPSAARDHKCGDGAEYHGLFFSLPKKDMPRVRDMDGHFLNTGCSGFVKTGGVIVAAAWFGMATDPRIIAALNCLDEVIKFRKGQWCGSTNCSLNILRAYAEHPKRAYGDKTRLAIKTLEKQQSKSGAWAGAPFYQALNIIGQVNISTARRQIERALPRLVRSQNPDGTWGHTDKWLKTYFVLDALQRQELLKSKDEAQTPKDEGIEKRRTKTTTAATRFGRTTNVRRAQ